MPVRFVSRVAIALALGASAACAGAPPPPEGPPEVGLDVRFTTLEVIDDREGGSGDWRVTLLVDGQPLGAAVLGEADAGGGVPIDRSSHSRGLEASHRLVITARVEEHDGGFDATWEFVGEETRSYGLAEGFGIGGQSIELDDDEGHVKLHFVVTRRPAR